MLSNLANYGAEIVVGKVVDRMTDSLLDKAGSVITEGAKMLFSGGKKGVKKAFQKGNNILGGNATSSNLLGSGVSSSNHPSTALKPDSFSNSKMSSSGLARLDDFSPVGKFDNSSTNNIYHDTSSLLGSVSSSSSSNSHNPNYSRGSSVFAHPSNNDSQRTSLSSSNNSQRSISRASSTNSSAYFTPAKSPQTQQNESATKIQKMVRGNLQLKKFKREMEEDVTVLEDSATKIKNAFRGHQARNEIVKQRARVSDQLKADYRTMLDANKFEEKKIHANFERGRSNRARDDAKNRTQWLPLVLNPSDPYNRGYYGDFAGVRRDENQVPINRFMPLGRRPAAVEAPASSPAAGAPRRSTRINKKKK